MPFPLPCGTARLHRKHSTNVVQGSSDRRWFGAGGVCFSSPLTSCREAARGELCLAAGKAKAYPTLAKNHRGAKKRRFSGTGIFAGIGACPTEQPSRNQTSAVRKANTGKGPGGTPCTTKSSFLCALRRFSRGAGLRRSFQKLSAVSMNRW